MELERYRRQIAIPEVGEAGQRKLASSSVLVVGAGGLGGPLLYALAGAGVGRLVVVDGDTVSLSNLNRQFLFEQADLGRPKAELAARRLAAFNPEIRAEGVQLRLEEQNAAELLKNCQLAVAAVDNLPARLALNAACAGRNIPLVNGGVEGWYGSVQAVEFGKTPCLACCYAGTEAPEGGQALGAVTGAVASLMASVALQMLLGHNPIPGQLLLYDGKRLELDRVPVERSPGCPVCGKDEKGLGIG